MLYEGFLFLLNEKYFLKNVQAFWILSWWSGLCNIWSFLSQLLIGHSQLNSVESLAGVDLISFYFQTQ